MLEKNHAAPEVLDLLGERSLVAAMLRFEAALARAQAATGLIPEAVAQSIIGTCKVELFDVSQLLRDSGLTGLAPALVASLRETVGLFNPQAAAFVYQGSGSEDVLLSAMALQTHQVLLHIEADVLASVSVLLVRAGREPATPLQQRSLSRPASTSSVGLVCVAWAAPLLRSLHRLRRTAAEALCVQLGSGGDEPGGELTRRMAQELALGVAAMPGLSRSDEWVVLASELGVLAGHLGKLAQDLALLGLPGPAAGMGTAALNAAQTVPHRVAMLLTALAQQDAWVPDWAEWTRLLLSVHGSARALAQALPGLQFEAQRVHLAKAAEETSLVPPQQLQALQQALRQLQAGVGT